MIKNKEELEECIKQDALAFPRMSTKSHIFGDEIWKFILVLRKYEYHHNQSGILSQVLRKYYYSRYHRYSIMLGFTIPINVIDKGLSIAHYGTIVINNNAQVGINCRIHEGVNIGATNGSDKAPIIGNNVFIGSGAKIIGDIRIADDVCIAAGAVVVCSISEPGTTWGGVPARKISNNNSHSNLSKLLSLSDNSL